MNGIEEYLFRQMWTPFFGLIRRPKFYVLVCQYTLVSPCIFMSMDLINICIYFSDSSLFDVYIYKIKQSNFVATEASIKRSKVP